MLLALLRLDMHAAFPLPSTFFQVHFSNYILPSTFFQVHFSKYIFLVTVPFPSGSSEVTAVVQKPGEVALSASIDDLWGSTRKGTMQGAPGA